MSPREGSGTSWQPVAPMEGLHVHAGKWMVMTHGFVNAAYDRQGGPRGGEKFFSASMLMSEAAREAGAGRVALRAMLSLDPLMGPSGYPLLLQTGETSNGREPLVDRQHPHDLFMELSARYTAQLRPGLEAFAYFGLPGEPALGPTVFMMRTSGADNPAAPLSHHWLDSTHVAHGVATLGAQGQLVKVDASVFTGREPDRYRWDLEKPRFDSYSARLTVAPLPELAVQYSFGHLVEPETLEHDVNVDRQTASLQWNARPGTQATFAWGHNRPIGGHAHGSDAFLLEAASRVTLRWTVFGRAERVDKNELFQEDEPLAHEAFTVHALTIGGVFDFFKRARWAAGAGSSVTVDLIPAALYPSYGKTPVSVMAWLRLKLI